MPEARGLEPRSCEGWLRPHDGSGDAATGRHPGLRALPGRRCDGVLVRARHAPRDSRTCGPSPGSRRPTPSSGSGRSRYRCPRSDSGRPSDESAVTRDDLGFRSTPAGQRLRAPHHAPQRFSAQLESPNQPATDITTGPGHEEPAGPPTRFDRGRVFQRRADYGRRLP